MQSRTLPTLSELLPFGPVRRLFNGNSPALDLRANRVGLGEITLGSRFLPRLQTLLDPPLHLGIGPDRIRHHVQHRIDASEDLSRLFQGLLVDTVSIELRVRFSHEGEQGSKR